MFQSLDFKFFECFECMESKEIRHYRKIKIKKNANGDELVHQFNWSGVGS